MSMPTSLEEELKSSFVYSSAVNNDTGSGSDSKSIHEDIRNESSVEVIEGGSNKNDQPASKKADKNTDKNTDNLALQTNTATMAKPMIQSSHEEEKEKYNESTLSSSEKEEPSSICSAINRLPSTSTMSIWKHVLQTDDNDPDTKSIRWASKAKHDFKFQFHDFTMKLSQYMTPQRLQMSIKNIPFRQWDQVGKILDLLYERFQYLHKGGGKGDEQKEGGTEPRKVQILVLGGSVTNGVRCKANPVNMKIKLLTVNRCAWPGRLQTFIEYFFGDIIEVHAVTLGGTNTAIGTLMWKYNLLPDNIPHQPDIVINAYSTNDMHVRSMVKATGLGITIEELVHEMNENFIRNVMKPQVSCSMDRKPPLLLYLDDYIGNEQKDIRTTMIFKSAVSQLSSYYGFGFMSYADTVREFVYGDTDEWWFSPDSWPERQIHPGMGAHISMMWVVAFNLLNVVTTYCDRLNGVMDGQEHLYHPSTYGSAELRHSEDILQGEPKPKINSSILPPSLSKDLSLDDISHLWRQEEEKVIVEKKKKNVNTKDECSDNTSTTSFTFNPCILKWMSGGHMDESAIMEQMNPFIVSMKGWEYESVRDKSGLHIPVTKQNDAKSAEVVTYTTADASIQLKFDVSRKESKIKVFNFVVMQSYGDKWENSTVEVQIKGIKRTVKGGKEGNSLEVRKEVVINKNIEMVGYHGRNTSESFHYVFKFEDDDIVTSGEVALNEYEKGGNDDNESIVSSSIEEVLNDIQELIVDIAFVGGNTFKIMGMMFCRF